MHHIKIPSMCNHWNMNDGCRNKCMGTMNILFFRCIDIQKKNTRFSRLFSFDLWNNILQSTKIEAISLILNNYAGVALKSNEKCLVLSWYLIPFFHGQNLVLLPGLKLTPYLEFWPLCKGLIYIYGYPRTWPWPWLTHLYY